MLPAEPFGEEATAHTRDMCMQREVEIKVRIADSTGGCVSRR